MESKHKEPNAPRATLTGTKSRRNQHTHHQGTPKAAFLREGLDLDGHSHPVAAYNPTTLLPYNPTPQHP
jgi:hypothetical protein